MQTRTPTPWLQYVLNRLDAAHKTLLISGVVLFLGSTAASIWKGISFYKQYHQVAIWFEVGLAALGLVGWLRTKISSGPHDPWPDADRTWRLFFELPHYEEQIECVPPFSSRYRFRAVDGDDDVENFVRMSSEAAAIREANPGLEPPERRKLYRLWHGINRNSFLMLERTQEGKTPDIIAVSIVVPLTNQGVSFFRQGLKPAIKLGPEDIQGLGEICRSILIDTWIIDRRSQDQHGRYGYALLLKHLSLFWSERMRKITFLVEPDHRTLPSLLERAGFSCCNTTAIGSSLYELTFPLRLSMPLKAEYKILRDNVNACRGWPVF
jgi:hypothetical protein